MKRALGIITIIAVILAISTVYAATFFLTSSGKLSSSQAVYASKCIYGGMKVITDGSNNATIKVYDNASAASGTQVDEATVTGSDQYGGMILPHPVRCSNGIYVSVSGTGAAVIIYYDTR